MDKEIFKWLFFFGSTNKIGLREKKKKKVIHELHIHTQKVIYGLLKKKKKWYFNAKRKTHMFNLRKKKIISM